jgi:leucyl-tRNA synthetase
VDFYVGGAEHATRHLIYARFWHKFLYDIGAVSYDEPFTRLQHVGLILAEDGRKMSKRWNNVINPDEIVEKYGADAMRVYEMFMGPFSQPVAWNTNGLIGARKFLERVWKLKSKVQKSESQKSRIQKLDNLLHKTIKKVGEDIESFKFNTAISQMMILVNEMTAADGLSKEQYEALLKILAPFAPHLCEELWTESRRQTTDDRNESGNESVFKQSWPKYDSELIKDEIIELVIQVNGKVRDTLSVDAEVSEEEAKKIALESENVKKWTENKEVKKIVYVKGKLVSIVVK